MFTKRYIILANIVLLTAIICATETSSLAQDSNEPSSRVLTIRLRNKSTEPYGEPTRIRVDNRSRVRLRLINLSPIDVCSPGGRTPSPTTETNPLEFLVTTIAGLGGFSLGTSTADNSITALTAEVQIAQQHMVASTLAQKRANPVLDDQRYKRFVDLATLSHSLAKPVVDEQNARRLSLDNDPNILAAYLAGDYRGRLWTEFNPANDVRLQIVRSDFTGPLPRLNDVAQMQLAADNMGKLATDLHKDNDKLTDPDTISTLSQMDLILAKTNAVLSVINDNVKGLQTAQTAVKAAYQAVVKVYADFRNRLDNLRTVRPSANGDSLIQEFDLPTDRKATITGVLFCVSDADGKPTTDNINYSVLYQDVPHLTASAGFLVSFLEKRDIGTTNVVTNNAAGFNTLFAVTDRAQAQALPIAYLNYRVLPALSKRWPKREDEMIITTSVSAGFGINPNTGTAQPEFFTGLAFGFNRFMIHPGIHFGRQQSLGGGFALNTTVPSGFAGTAPISWSYHPAFSLGFSVRMAPF